MAINRCKVQRIGTMGEEDGPMLCRDIGEPRCRGAVVAHGFDPDTKGG